MVRIGLISDTHSYIDRQLPAVFSTVDEIWHAGDIGTPNVCAALQQIKPLYAVHGNIDGRDIRIDYPADLILHREGLKILITHIGGYPGNYHPRARKLIEAEKPDIFICGHSHILKVMRDSQYHNMLTINPGAAGTHGFHKVKTVLRFTLNNGKVENMEVVELGKRGEIVG